MPDSVVFDTSAMHLIKKGYTWFTNSHQISVVSSGEIQESGDTRSSVPTNSWNPTEQNPRYKKNCKNQMLNPEKNGIKTWKFLRKEKKHCCVFLPSMPISSDNSVSPDNSATVETLAIFLRASPLPQPSLSYHRLSKGHWACIAGRAWNLKTPPFLQVFPYPSFARQLQEPRRNTQPAVGGVSLQLSAIDLGLICHVLPDNSKDEG